MRDEQNKLLTDITIKIPKEAEHKFAQWMLAEEYSRGTVRRYILSIQNLLGKNRQISPKLIIKYLHKKNTVSKRCAIKLFLNYLEVFNGIRLDHFVYPRKKKTTKALEVISKENIDKMIRSIRPEFKLFLKVMYHGGLRLAETIQIRSSSFNFKDWNDNKEDYGELRIIKGKRNKDRIVPIHPNLMRELFMLIPLTSDGYLEDCYLFDFGYDRYIKRKMSLRRKYKKFTPTGKKVKGALTRKAAHIAYVERISRFFQKSLRETSMKELNRYVKPHSIRASRATHLDESNLPPSDIQYFLGHDNLSTTSRYIINTPVKLKKAIKKIDNY